MANPISLADVILRNKKIGQKNVDPFPDFNFWDWLKRSARQVANQASQTWNSGGILGDATRAYAAAQDQYGADRQTLSLMGILLPEKSAPAPSEMREPTHFRELPTNKGLEFIGQTIGDPINYVGPALKYIDASKAAAESAIGMASQPGGANASQLIVYHGSPHKFDKLDSRHIGTGEGAQAYSHGLYMSQAPDVAKSYIPRDFDIEKALLGQYKLAEKANDYGKMEVLESALLHQTPSELRKQFAGRGLDKYIDLVDAYYKKSKGYLYTIDLPDDMIARMLDWDKPLSQQAPEVQKAFNTWASPHMSTRQVGPDLVDVNIGGASIGAFPQSRVAEVMASPSSFVPTRGEDFWRLVGGDIYGAGVPDEVARAALLRDQNIPGVRYLDGSSRGAGQGTSNFVVFPGEEGRLTILERNGEKLRDVLLK